VHESDTRNLIMDTQQSKIQIDDLKELLIQCLKIVKDHESQHTKTSNLKKKIRDLLSGVEL
jgi:hypothetical protein